MKVAKSHKIILLLTALIMCVVCLACGFCALSVNAESVNSPKATSYFKGSGSASAEFSNGGVTFKVDKDSAVSFKNELAIDDAKLEVKLGTGVEKLELVLTYDSYYVNGNKNAEGNFDKEIKNSYVLNKNEVTIKVAHGGYVAVNDVVKSTSSNEPDDYYRIRKVDKASAEITFKPVLAQGATEGSFTIISVDQKATDGNGEFKQTFVLEDDKLECAKPVVAINAPIFVRTHDGYFLKGYEATTYSLTYKVFSVLGNIATSELYPVALTNDISIPTNEKNENLDKFSLATGNVGKFAQFKICSSEDNKEVVYENYSIEILEVLDKDSEDNYAPEYLMEDNLALEAFRAELKKQYIGTDGKYEKIGAQIKLPSFEDLIFDDRTAFSALSPALYSVSDEKQSSSSALQITLETLGDYYFYVSFTDKDGKGMNAEEDFVIYDDEGVPSDYGRYGCPKGDENFGFVFYFTIVDDEGISILPASSQGTGYVNTKYTASKFDIKAASEDKRTFTLWYNPSREADVNLTDGWVEIKQLKDVEEDYEDENGYTYEILEKINYNGEYSFTPNKVGSYKIICKVTSDLAVNGEQSATSTAILINEEAKVVTPENTWLQDNVWSVVFLSVGSLCLVAIVVLLCIKPKEKTDSEK